MANGLSNIWDAAKECDVSPWTLRKHLARGNVKAVRIGRLIKLSRDEILRIQREGLPSLRQKPR